MEPGDLVFMQWDDNYDSLFKAGDIGMIIAVVRSIKGMFEVLVNGKIEYLFHYEMVLVDGAERLPIY